MPNYIKTNPNAHGFILQGNLGFQTVKYLRDEGNVLIENTPGEILFDFEQVTHSDSSALTLLTAWTRCARKWCKPIRFINLPPKLKEVACLSNLDKILGGVSWKKPSELSQKKKNI